MVVRVGDKLKAFLVREMTVKGACQSANIRAEKDSIYEPVEGCFSLVDLIKNEEAEWAVVSSVKMQ